MILGTLVALTAWLSRKKLWNFEMFNSPIEVEVSNGPSDIQITSVPGIIASIPNSKPVAAMHGLALAS